jgi:hypothetical protein
VSAVPIPKPEPPGSAAPSKRSHASVLFLLLGVGLTLLVVLVMRLTERSATTSSSAQPSSAAPAKSSALGEAGADFAELYLTYLLKTYYVETRGFCPKLLEAICKALVTTELLESEASCTDLPNMDLVLAIGRFQHGTGLPVDGKAGPETVRLILGGDFSSRREIANRYCPGAPGLSGIPAEPILAPSSSGPSSIYPSASAR